MEEGLKKRKIRLSCFLRDKKDQPVAVPGDVLTIGDDLDEATAKSLLAGGSAELVSREWRMAGRASGE